MNRNDFEKYIKGLSNEQLLDIRAEVEIEYIKRVLYKQGASLLKSKLGNEKCVEYNGTTLYASNIAKQFYKALDQDFFVNKYKFHKMLNDQKSCLLTTIQKRLNILFDSALIAENVEVLTKQEQANLKKLESNLQK